MFACACASTLPANVKAATIDSIAGLSMSISFFDKAIG
jgi:hypothetical protein